MIVTDANNGKMITSVPIGDGCDGVAFDAFSKRIYISRQQNLSQVRAEGLPSRIALK
jgi:hypothetical protein